MKVSYDSNKLVINGQKIELMPLPANIEQIVIYDDSIVVRYQHVSHIKDKYETWYRNIFAVNEKTEVLWQIEEALSFCREGESKPDPAPFVNIWINDKGVLQCAIGMGVNYDVDIKTGKLSNHKVQRW
jgi:hypothetical protein